MGSKPDAVTTAPVSQPVASQPAEQQPAQPASTSGRASAYAQCGGKTWTGSTVCEPGCTCVSRGDHYSQCVPPVGASTCGSGRRLRARIENFLLQRRGELERSSENRIDDDRIHGADEL